MPKEIKPVYKPKFEQVCIVVKDTEKSAMNMWNNFGIGPWDIAVVHADSMKDLKYWGKPAKFGFKAGIAQVGGFEIELMEPLEGDSVYREHLNKYGEGIQHFRSAKMESLEAFYQAVKDLEKAGFPCAQSGRCIPGTFAYIDTRKVLNTMLEIYWPDPAMPQPPKPDYVIPR